jgi:hypothetical protein
MIFCLEDPKLVKIAHFTIRPNDGLMLRAIKALSSNEMVPGCRDSQGGINIKRTLYKVTL